MYNNKTPTSPGEQGFREGVKMALDRGVKPTKEEFLNGLKIYIGYGYGYGRCPLPKNGNWQYWA